MRLYYHKTDGGAEYLFSNHLKDSEEGCIEGSKYIVRIDGDIEKDAELNVVEEKEEKYVRHCPNCQAEIED